MRRAPKRGLPRIAYQAGLPQAVLLLPEEEPGSIPLRGPDSWTALPPAVDSGMVLTTLEAGGAASWEAPSGGGDGLTGGWSIDGGSCLLYGTKQDAGDRLSISEVVAGPLRVNLNNEHGSGSARISVSQSTSGASIWMDAGNGIAIQEFNGSNYSWLRSNGALYIGHHFLDCIEITATEFNLQAPVTSQQGHTVLLPSGKILNVKNGSGQLIFRVDASGNVDAAGTITPLLGAGFS